MKLPPELAPLEPLMDISADALAMAMADNPEIERKCRGMLKVFDKGRAAGLLFMAGEKFASVVEPVEDTIISALMLLGRMRSDTPMLP